MRYARLPLILALLLLSGCMQPVSSSPSTLAPLATAQITLAPTPSFTPAPPPSPTPLPEDWFVGEWVGCASNNFADANLSDFGAAIVNLSNIINLEIVRSGEGYIATLDRYIFDVIPGGKDSFALLCTGILDVDDSIADLTWYPYPPIDIGERIDLTYTAHVPSSIPDARVPEKNILHGVYTKEGSELTMNLLLAHLPPSAGNVSSEASYPYWIPGYENMEGTVRGLFCLGETPYGRRLLGLQVSYKGQTLIITEEDGVNTTQNYVARDMRSTDLAFDTPIWNMPDVKWRRFSSYSEKNFRFYNTLQNDTTTEHAAYFREEYIPALQAEIAAMEPSIQKGNPRDLIKEAELLARKGLLDYAQRLVQGTLPPRLAPLVPDMVTLDEAYLARASLAGIFSGDTLEDAQKLYTLTLATETSAKVTGFENEYYSSTYHTFYTDGKGLLIKVANSDHTVCRVYVNKPGYGVPAGRDVGDAFTLDSRYIRVKDAGIEFKQSSLDSEAGAISMVTMTCIQDRLWDEMDYDIDRDGVKEHITLSGRCDGTYVERGTVLGDPSEGIEALDYGTRARLSVYKNGVLAEEVLLPLYIYYFIPEFADKQPGKKNDLRIACPTGGNGNSPIASYYRVKKLSDGTYSVTFEYDK